MYDFDLKFNITLLLFQESLNSVDEKKKIIDDNDIGTTNILADRRNKLETAAQVSVHTHTRTIDIHSDVMNIKLHSCRVLVTIIQFKFIIELCVKRCD